MVRICQLGSALMTTSATSPRSVAPLNVARSVIKSIQLLMPRPLERPQHFCSKNLLKLYLFMCHHAYFMGERRKFYKALK